MKTKGWVIVTGAGGGIGEIVVQKLLVNNYKVICTDKETPISNLKNKLNNIEYKNKLEFLEIDLDSLSMTEGLKHILEHKKENQN